jgi:hypothetical protein
MTTASVFSLSFFGRGPESEETGAAGVGSVTGGTSGGKGSGVGAGGGTSGGVGGGKSLMMSVWKIVAQRIDLSDELQVSRQPGCLFQFARLPRQFWHEF